MANLSQMSVWDTDLDIGQIQIKYRASYAPCIQHGQMNLSVFGHLN
jgi:hypothetical protein